LAVRFPGSGRCVSLPASQQSLLNGMDRALQARDPRLASMFAMFELLAGDDGPPPAERLAPVSRSLAGWLRALAGRARAAASIPVVLAAGLMAAVITLGVATSGWKGCSPAAQRSQTRSEVQRCGSRPSGQTKSGGRVLTGHMDVVGRPD